MLLWRQVLSAIFLPILAPMHSSAQPSPVLQEAAHHHRAGRLEQAAELYRRALQADRNNPSILLAFGALLLQQDQIDQARSLLERVAALRPGSVDAWMALGSTLARQEAFAEAAQAFGRATILCPDMVAAHVNLGNVLRRLGRITQAIASYRKAIALDPGSVQAQYNLGNALADSDAFDEAVDAFKTALALEPAYLPAKNNLGNILLRQHRYEAALACYKDVIAADPVFPHGSYNIGVALQELGQLGSAIASYRRALELDPRDLGSLNNLCITLLRNGDPREALIACERYLELSPANRKPLAYKAAALIELGQREQAHVLLDFEKLILQGPVDVPINFPSISAFNLALTTHIQRHSSLRFEPPDKSTRGGSQTGELMIEPKGVAGTLENVIRGAVATYMQHLRSVLPTHPYVTNLPSRWRLATWAVVLRGQGYQGPHFHPDGFVSGVYYVSLPKAMGIDQGDAGCIEFGRTSEAMGGSHEPLLELVHPQEGLMLLFPSYFYHRTIPFESDEPRISVAFDVIPES